MRVMKEFYVQVK